MLHLGGLLLIDLGYVWGIHDCNDVGSDDEK
jgi:hypothetical protein